MNTQSADRQILEQALSTLHATASNFAFTCIKDSSVRAQYMRDITATSNEYRNLIQVGKMTAQDAAEQVSSLRNNIMDLSRLRSSPIGRAYAMKLKRYGRSMAELTEKYAQRQFRKGFETLSESQKTKNYLEIVRSAGRHDPAVAALAQKLGKIGRRLFLVSLAVAVYEVYEAEDKPMEVARQGIIAGAGIVGGATVGAGAVAAGVCAATAPVCVGAAALIGGMLFAFGADLTFGTIYPQPANR